MHRANQDKVLLRGRRFDLTAIIPSLDLNAAPLDPAVEIAWQDAELPDVAAVKDYLPPVLPFGLENGKAALDGQIHYRDGVVSSRFMLDGDGITGKVLEETVVGHVDVELVIKEADVEARRIDLSGTKLRMQAAAAAGTETAEQEPLVTELEIPRARLESSLSWDEIKEYPGRPPFNGVLELKGTVANLGFLNEFLPGDQGIELGGSGTLTANLQLVENKVGPGSRVEVQSRDLVSRFLGFEATGTGAILGEVQSVDAGQEAKLDVELRDVAVKQKQEDALFLRSESLRLTATTPVPDPGALPTPPSAVLELKGAEMPDVAVMNRYLPAQRAFNLTSGRGLLEGQLSYGDQTVAGALNLTGDRITTQVFNNNVVGQLGLDLIIQQANLETRQLDLSGTRIEMQALAPEGAKRAQDETLRTIVEIPEARFQSPPAPDKTAKGKERPPVDGTLKLRGEVANIDFLNRFLPDEHGLELDGNGRFTADLQLMAGSVGPGSRMEVRSADLLSRFLDFEATGAGLVNAAIEGRAEAPGGSVGVFLARFGLRKLDEATPYVTGRSFEITTRGERFNPDEGIRGLSTVIKLPVAEIPDMTVYNAYLPEKAGIAIVSGSGQLNFELNINGVSGSGNLELRAGNTEIRISDQTVKGTLWLKTRLRDGNLDTMEFDISGSQLGIENGSLQSGGEVRNQWWWGQIDLEQGRMRWKKPLDLDAQVALKLRDSGLLVNMFVKQTRGREWLEELLLIRDVVGHGNIGLGNEAITLRDTQLSGEAFLVLSNLRLREQQIQGGLYARFGVLRVGVELNGEERRWRIVNPRRWFDEFAESFTRQNP